MRIPIRYQFMFPLLAVAVASLLAVGVINSRLVTRQIQARIEQQLQGVVGVLATSTYPLTDSVLRQMGGLANAEFVLTDAKGNQLASGCSAHVSGLAANAFTARTVAEVALGQQLMVDSKPYLHSSVWVQQRTNLTQPSILHILFAQDEFDAAWRSAFLPPVIVGMATIFAVALVTQLVAGRVSNVLSRLGRDVQRLAEGDFSAIIRPKWNDETNDLAVAVNQTAVRLADYESELRQTERMRTVAMLGAGLTHEMRNAATGCRLAVDLHAENCHDDHTDDDSLHVARRQLLLMENRLQQLLQLGRNSPSSSEQLVDLSELVSESVALITPAARHAGIGIDWRRPDGNVGVLADSELLGQAVMNVLLNAVDAAAKNQAMDTNRRSCHSAGFVAIELQQIDGESQLVVTDSGDGPSEPLAENVFDPFVTTKSEGVGLGLAVAKRVVQSYGGHIDWQRDCGVTKFSIRLPQAATGVAHV